MAFTSDKLCICPFSYYAWYANCELPLLITLCGIVHLLRCYWYLPFKLSVLTSGIFFVALSIFLLPNCCMPYERPFMYIEIAFSYYLVWCFVISFKINCIVWWNVIFIYKLTFLSIWHTLHRQAVYVHIYMQYMYVGR